MRCSVSKLLSTKLYVENLCNSHLPAGDDLCIVCQTFSPQGPSAFFGTQTMPVYGHQHSSSGPGRYENNNAVQPASSLYKVTPTLGSSSTPGNDWRNPVSSAGISSSYSTSAGQPASPNNFAGHSRLNRSESSPSGPSRPQFERQGEDRTGPPSYGQPTQQSYGSSTNAAQSARAVSATGGMSLPGALQPGRPAVVSSNTAPSSVPTLPPISNSTQSQQFSSPSRASTASHSHSYSHSSPAPPYLDEATRYASTPTRKYMAAQTAQTATYSPLGLADIRPRGDSGIDDGPPSAYPYQDVHTEPTNCNYLAPWAVYSFDWCKWPVHQHGLGDAAGKVAIGSYLEDGHNYVSNL